MLDKSVNPFVIWVISERKSQKRYESGVDHLKIKIINHLIPGYVRMEHLL